MMHIRMALPVLALSLLASLPAAGAAQDELAAHRATWQAAQVQRYSYGYRKFCECHRDAPPETVVTVDGGSISRVYHRHDDSEREVPAREGSTDLYWTIDDLFDLIASAMAREAEVRVNYDAALGYPTSLYIDYDAGYVGDELDIRLTGLDVLD